MLIAFFDYEAVVYHIFVPRGQRMNTKYYLEVLKRLREAVRKKDLIHGGKKWMLHQDNAPAHSSLLIREFLTKINHGSTTTSVLARSRPCGLLSVSQTQILAERTTI
jgi:hypothetical protein